MARKPAEQTVSREAILLAAAAVFHEKGYHRAKMEDIAAEVSLTAGSLYHHFPEGKQEILLAVLNEGIESVATQVEEVIASDISSEEKLRRVVRLHITSLTGNISIATALVFEIRTMLDIPEVREAYTAHRDKFEKNLRKIVQEGVEKGVFCPVDVKLFVRMILGAQNWVGVWYRPEGTLTGQEIADQMATWFIKALKAN